MKRIECPDEMRDYVISLRASGKSSKTVGVVPTMGALHDGHMSLVRLANQHCDRTVATIFVNPTQFGPGEDLDKYPRTLEDDCAKLASEGTAAVFIPNAQAMYSKDFSTYVQPPKVAETLEGECRPGHFRGVATVVLKLFQIVPATHAIFGRKDYQQLQLIKAMCRDLNVGIEIIAGDTVREPDGLALSSRNRYLSDTDRNRALLLQHALREVVYRYGAGENRSSELEASMNSILLGNHASGEGVDAIDYAVVVDGETLDRSEMATNSSVALIAAFVGGTRLIDNLSLRPNEA